jgi:2-oxoisovalerate dehydrogenase E1 component
VKRYPTFEPPEYRDWHCTPEALAAIDSVLAATPGRQRHVEALSSADLLGLYRGLLRFRLLDIALKRWVLQGVISKAWLGTGEEAVTIGTVRALGRDDVVGPMIRNEGVCAERGMPLADVFRSYLATEDGPTRGRDLHHGSLEHGIISPISHVGALVPVLCGMALAFRLRSEPRVALTYVGDGSTRTGEFHEGLCLAASQRVPLVVVIQDNGVALGTLRDAHTPGAFDALAEAYGVRGLTCDGNNVLDVHAAATEAVAHARAGGGPVVLVARTFRMGGHATHDESEARALFDAEDFRRWGERDPCGVYEEWLATGRDLGGTPAADTPEARREANLTILRRIEDEVTAEIEVAAAEAQDSARRAVPDPASLEDGVQG